MPTAFIAGAAFALVARPSLVARRPDPFGPSLHASLLFALLYSLGVGWAAWKAPDWMLNYFVPVEQLSLPLWAVHAVFVLACLLAAGCAHTLTAVFLQRGSRTSAWLTLGSGLLLLGSLWWLTLDRYQVVGSYAQWLQGTATPLPQSAIAAGFNLLGVVFVMAFIVPAVLLFRAGQRLRPA